MHTMNARPLRVLHVEDNPAHVEMVRMLLETEGFGPRVTRVDTEPQFRRALAEGVYDLIVSDCTMPAFDGLAALALARERCPDLPFVFYSGTIGDEAAVESLKRGAMDFVPKGRPEKLGPTIRRVMQEVEERCRRQARVLRQQRLECLGNVTAGVAHGLNNVITSVMLAADQLWERLSDDNDRQILEMMQGSAQRAREMIGEILAFVRGTGDELTILDLKSLLGELTGLLKAIYPRSIRFDVRIAGNLQPVQGNATQLYQILMNLCGNARDAMPNGGLLTIEAANISLKAEEKTGQPLKGAGPYVVLTVKDDGVGIPAEALEKVFEPYFSTKEVGQGAGLGLSTAQGIVKRHRGIIKLSSQLGKGTACQVYLPAMTPADTGL
jgi:signal transduction histidine kinase